MSRCSFWAFYFFFGTALHHSAVFGVSYGALIFSAVFDDSAVYGFVCRIDASAVWMIPLYLAFICRISAYVVLRILPYCSF